jgi:hypothetical protein
MIYGKNDTNRLPRTPREAANIPLASLGIAALHEALAAIPNDDARRSMARLIATSGRKYTAQARATAADIGAGITPLPLRNA